jgi:hypothetical protein
MSNLPPKRGGVVFAAVVAAAAALWAFSDSLPFRREVTVYLAFCPGGRTSGQCKANEEYANPTTYAANADSQNVVYWSWGTAPRRYSQCAVRNAWNWSCPLGSPADPTPAYVQMIDGQIDERFRLSKEELFYQVPKWYWWLLRLTSKQLPA